MRRDVIKPTYPENAYCAIFGCLEYPDIPSDAEETLEYVVKTLTPREADMFMLNFKDEMTYVEIGEQYGIHKQRVQQIISKAVRKLRHASRSEIISVGREVYLKTILAVNEEEKKHYYERISELERLINKQTAEVTDSIGISSDLDTQARTHLAHILDTSIDGLKLSVRSWNGLSRAGIRTVKDIIEYGDLYGIWSMGRVSIQEVHNKMAQFLKSRGYD